MLCRLIVYILVVCLSVCYYCLIGRINVFIKQPTTHANGCRGRIGFLLPIVFVSVSLHDISKTDSTRITKFDEEMLHVDSWKRIYLGVKRSKVKATSHKNIAGVGLCTFGATSSENSLV